jgi:hypothetical protein
LAGLVLNVPYGALAAPPPVARRLGLGPDDWRRENWRLSDPYLLGLAREAAIRGRDSPPRPLLAYGYSPLVADPMGLMASEMGQGEPGGPVLLAKDTSGRELPDWGEAERTFILQKTCEPYLSDLGRTCLELLAKENLVCLVTLRSFSSEPESWQKDRRRPRPQIFLGASSGHTPEGLAHLAGTVFRAMGFWPQLGWPLSVSNPPAAVAGEGRLKTLDVGLRRDLYLDERTGKSKEAAPALVRVLRLFLGLLEQELDRVAKLRLRRAFPPKKPSSVLKAAPKDRPEKDPQENRTPEEAARKGGP